MAVSDLALKGESQGESPPDGEAGGEVWRVKIKQQAERSDVASPGKYGGTGWVRVGIRAVRVKFAQNNFEFITNFRSAICRRSRAPSS